MPTWAHDLSYEECDAWRAALRLDWEPLLVKAGLGTNKDTIKNRWKNYDRKRSGEELDEKAVVLGRDARERIRQVLEAAESRKPTEVGATIVGLEEWNRLGALIARRPRVFLDQLGKLREISSLVEERIRVDEAVARADAKERDVLGQITPEPDPKKPRK